MPTAQVPVNWKTEDVEIREWIEEDSLASWRDPRTATSNDLCIDTDLDIYHGLRAEFERAKSILQLVDDWDGEGSLGYSEETLGRAIAFLTEHTRALWELYGILSPVPRIGPGPDGSIDLHWKEPTWELLVNIPADVNEMAAFYGDNYGSQKIRGSLDPKKFNLGIAGWLMN